MKIKLFHKEIEVKVLLEVLLIHMIFAGMVAGVYVLGPAITGFITVTKQNNYTDTVSLEFNEDSEYIWNLGNVGEVKSIKIDGSKSKDGEAKVYIENNGMVYLIFDSEKLVEKESGIFGITGFAVLEEELRVEVDGVLNPEQQEILDLLVSDVNGTRSNVEIEIEFEDGEVKKEVKGTTELQNELVENLSSGLNSTVKIKIESEFKENNAPVWNSNASSFNLNGSLNIDLSLHFFDGDGDELIYSASNISNVSVEIDGDVVRLAPDPNVSETKLITFAAFDGVDIGYKTVSLVVDTVDANESAENETEAIIKDIGVRLEYGDEEFFDEDNDGVEALEGVIDFTTRNTLFDWDVIEDNLCTRYEVFDGEESTFVCYGNSGCCAFVNLQNSRDSWNESLFLTYGSLGSDADNLVFAQVLHVDYNLSVEDPYTDIAFSKWANLTAKFVDDSIKFEDVCVDTCVLSGLNESSYKLIVEVENSTLRIDVIKYTLEEKTANKNPLLIKPIENISIIKNKNYTINLSEYFLDEDELVYSYFETGNISIRFEDDSAYIIPDSGFVGERFTFITTNDSYASVSSNVFKVEVVDSNYTNKTVKPTIKLGEPVKWNKTIKVNKSNETVKIKVPETASNLSIKGLVNNTAENISNGSIKIIDKGKNKTREEYEKSRELSKLKRKIGILKEAKIEDALKVVFDDGEIGKEELDIKLSEYESREYELMEEQQNDSGALITGAVAAEISQTEEISSNETIVEINETVDEVTIEYFTEAPYAVEKEIGAGRKQIKIISETSYENILVFTDIKESNKDSVRLFHVNESGKELVDNVDYIDNNSNGLIDRLEWVVPHLSNESYEVVIEITKAVHLDENRSFIADIFDYVKAKDDNWTGAINESHYIRVTFEQELNSSRDITLYARNNQSLNTTVEVYHFNTTNKITEFPIIREEKYYRVLLTGMNGSHDTFDLRIVNLDNVSKAYLEFDHIVDPDIFDLNITNPTTSSPFTNVSGGDNLTIGFRVFKNGVEQTSGVDIDNVTIGGTFTEINLSNESSLINEFHTFEGIEKAYKGVDSVRPTDEVPNTADSEYNTSEYTNINNSDDSDVVQSTSADNEFDYMMYVYNLGTSKDRVINFTWIWEGVGSGGDVVWGVTFYARNFTSETWQQIGSNTADSDTTQTLNLSSRDFINGTSQEAWLLVMQTEQTGSCPFIYSYDGKKYSNEHESFPYSIIKVGEESSYSRLKNLKAVNGEYTLDIREELYETSYIDDIELTAVKHNASFVMPDLNGKIHTIKTLEQPLSCKDKYGNDCLNLVKQKDGLYWTDNLEDHVEK